MRKVIQRIRDDERGHAIVGVISLVAAIGALVLTMGVTSNDDTVAWIGGVVLAVGIFGASAARHRSIDYDVYARLEKLEK